MISVTLQIGTALCM